ncbi:signal peptidase II [Tautonia sociabilis]|uniref:Lipoprotein signal peptidase n=2 Tax=Tautonia sociabilis TaxID=2080755 RepID=A0A432MNS5_9BACT|nr:signal peptidase II [Tautonia sociabilis]
METRSQSGIQGDRDARPAVPASRWVLFWALALGGAAFDLTTKAVIFDWVGPPGSPAASVVGEVVELRTSYNTGALWGIGGELSFSSLMFAALSIVAAVFIVYWLFVLGHASDRWQTIALGLIMAGAIGNCYDRLRFGHVRDFVHVHVDSIGFDFPIFNFADNMLVIGAIGLMLLAMRPEPKPPETSPES